MPLPPSPASLQLRALAVYLQKDQGCCIRSGERLALGSITWAQRAKGGGDSASVALTGDLLTSSELGVKL